MRLLLSVTCLLLLTGPPAHAGRVSSKPTAIGRVVGKLRAAVHVTWHTGPRNGLRVLRSREHSYDAGTGTHSWGFKTKKGTRMRAEATSRRSVVEEKQSAAEAILEVTAPGPAWVGELAASIAAASIEANMLIGLRVTRSDGSTRAVEMGGNTGLRVERTAGVGGKTELVISGRARGGELKITLRADTFFPSYWLVTLPRAPEGPWTGKLKHPVAEALQSLEGAADLGNEHHIIVTVEGEVVRTAPNMTYGDYLTMLRELISE